MRGGSQRSAHGAEDDVARARPAGSIRPVSMVAGPTRDERHDEMRDPT